MKKYLDINKDNSEELFKDISVKEMPHAYIIQSPVLCPQCKGHGRWNLTLDAYGKGQHFQASCAQCWGWGWVEKGTTHETCIHDFSDQRSVGRCLHEWKCVKCGYSVEVDSSD